MTEDVTHDSYEAPAVVNLGSIADLTQAPLFGGTGGAYQQHWPWDGNGGYPSAFS